MSSLLSESDSDSLNLTDLTNLSNLLSTTKERGLTLNRESLPIINKSTRRFVSALIRGNTTLENSNISYKSSCSNITKITICLTENLRLYIAEFLDTYKDTKAFDNYKILTGIVNYNDEIREFSIALTKGRFSSTV